MDGALHLSDLAPPDQSTRAGAQLNQDLHPGHKLT